MKVQIEDTRLIELLDAENRLNALIAGGVDNWEGFDAAMENYWENE